MTQVQLLRVRNGELTVVASYSLNAPETQSAETIPVFQKLWVVSDSRAELYMRSEAYVAFATITVSWLVETVRSPHLPTIAYVFLVYPFTQVS